MNQQIRVKLSLYLNYFVFAILLNSVGIVILKAQKVYGVDELQASSLELFKDMPIAIVSFLIASFLPRIGYKKAMLIALGLVSFACIYMYYGNSFISAKVLFASVGAAFALIKVSVYSVIGLVTENKKEHNSLMSSIEGVFMFGIALAYFLFPAFNNESDHNSWLRVYWLLAGISLASFVFLYFADFKKDYDIPGANLAEDMKVMLKLLTQMLVLVFVISAFLFVMIEQGIMTWLPSFNERVLQLPENVSIMMASILAISLGVGRLLAGQLVKRFNWLIVLTFCIVAALAMVFLVLPHTVTATVSEISKITDVPLIGYAFPLVGLFIAPIYPLLNSVVLSALPKSLHSPMTGLIVIFSAIGGTLGSRIVGYLFQSVGASSAFYYTSIPLIGLLICLFILNKLTKSINV